MDQLEQIREQVTHCDRLADQPDIEIEPDIDDVPGLLRIQDDGRADRRSGQLVSPQPLVELGDGWAVLPRLPAGAYGVDLADQPS